MTKNDLSKKPFLTDVKTAVNVISEAIEKQKKLIIFPLKMKWMMQSLSLLPSSLLNIIMFRKAKWMKNE